MQTSIGFFNVGERTHGELFVKMALSGEKYEFRAANTPAYSHFQDGLRRLRNHRDYTMRITLEDQPDGSKRISRWQLYPGSILTSHCVSSGTVARVWSKK